MLRSLALFIITFILFSQSAFAVKPAWKIQKLHEDTLRRVAIAHRRAEADSIRMHVVQVVFSMDYADSLLKQINHLHNTLNSITNQSKYGFKTIEIDKNLKDMQTSIQVISESLARDSTVLNISNLQMFKGLLIDMVEKLHGWKDALYTDKKDLEKMSSDMNAFIRDSLAQKVASDSNFANLHLDELLILTERWKEAKAITNDNIVRIDTLQANVSRSYFDLTELQNIVNNQLAGTATKAFSKEYNFLWDIHPATTLDEVTYYTKQSFNERMKVLKYYLTLNIAAWLSIVIIGFVFFLWVFRNYRRIKAIPVNGDVEAFPFKYIHPVPVLSTLIFILSLAPFYGFDQPALYVEILQLLVLIPLTFLFLRTWPHQLFFYWGLLVALCACTSVMNAIITPGWPLRFFLLGLNIVSVLFGVRFLSAYKKTMPLGKMVWVVAILYIVMNVLAIISNTAGRLTLAKILTSAGVAGLTQIIGLFVLVYISIEAFYLQMKSSRIASGMAQKFSYEEIQNGLFSLLSIGAIVFWLITFATNLEIYNGVRAFLDTLLNTQRSIGSTSFTIGNILSFILILYVVSVLQKYIGYFFGETEEDFVGDLDKKESRLVIFRLIIIMVGFFIAVVASGLPVDKVTVVLGALGVGIGLGLQNIVYNLVSGVILIFEKPMQIGDYIEVADKQGRVQNIGIRASKLVTPDGSEIIVPNGDILSSHMVNWTRSNNNRRTKLSFGIEPSSELETAKSVILEELKASPHVIPERPVEILVNNLSEKSAAISINVWINSIYKEEEFKSEVLANIYKRLSEKNVKIV